MGWAGGWLGVGGYERDDIDFFNCQFPILDGDATRSTYYGINYSQLIQSARTSSHAAYLNIRNALLITQKHTLHANRVYNVHITFFLSIIPYNKFHFRPKSLA